MAGKAFVGLIWGGLYGVLMIGLGAYGYAAEGSVISFAMGAIVGAALLVAAFWFGTTKQNKTIPAVQAVIALLMTILFAYRWSTDGRLYAVILCAVSGVSVPFFFWIYSVVPEEEDAGPLLDDGPTVVGPVWAALYGLTLIGMGVYGFVEEDSLISFILGASIGAIFLIAGYCHAVQKENRNIPGAMAILALVMTAVFAYRWYEGDAVYGLILFAVSFVSVPFFMWRFTIVPEESTELPLVNVS